MNGWLIFLGLLAAYVGVLALLRRRQGPLPGNFEVQGPFILWRTQFGKKAIRRVAVPARFWNVVADVGIVLTWLVGLAIFALLLYQFSLYFTAPDLVKDSAQPPEFLIGIPGVNPLIPVGYGLAALVIALVIHEGSHGVMAYAARMRVKSLGLLFFVIPVGAFVEPDEEDLERATAREKNRVFAAGPTSNILLALVTGSILSLGFAGAMTPVNDGEGVVVQALQAGGPAEGAGLRPGDLVTHLDNERIVNRSIYLDAVGRAAPGQQMTVRFLREGTPMQVEVVLADRSEFVPDEAPGKGFLGVVAVDMALIGLLRESFESPFSSLGAFFLYISYPFVIFTQKLDILATPYSGLFTLEGPLAGLPPALFYGTATLLYWIVWINIMLGTFNALPAGPLDGGQMFRTTLRDRLMRRYKVDRSKVHVERADIGGLQLRGGDEETQRKLDRIQVVVRKATWTLGLFILGLILLPLIGPQVLNLFL